MKGFFLPIYYFSLWIWKSLLNPSHNACQWCWGWCTCTPRCFQQLKHSSSKDSYHPIPSFIWYYHTIPKKKHIQKKSETPPFESVSKRKVSSNRRQNTYVQSSAFFLLPRSSWDHWRSVRNEEVAVTLSSEGSVTFRTGKVQHASAARSW